MASPQPSWIFASLILLDGMLFSAVGLYLIVRSFRQLVLASPTNVAPIPQAKKAKAQRREQRSVPSQSTEANQLIAFLVALGLVIFAIFVEIEFIGHITPYKQAHIGTLTSTQIAFVRDTLKKESYHAARIVRLQIIRRPDEGSIKLANQLSAIAKDIGWILIGPPRDPDPDYKIPPGLRIFSAPNDSGALNLIVALDSAGFTDGGDQIETTEMYGRGYFVITISDRWW